MVLIILILLLLLCLLLLLNCYMNVFAGLRFVFRFFPNNFRPVELDFCVNMRHLLHQLRMESYKRKILRKNILQESYLDMTTNKVR